MRELFALERDCIDLRIVEPKPEFCIESARNRNGNCGR